MKKKVLVTGGTGFIGSALVKGLLAKDYTVRILDDDSRGNQDNIIEVKGQVEIFTGDIRDAQVVMAATHGIDIVYHLAFVNGTKYFYEVPELVLDVGVRGCLNTVKAAISNKVERYILASSSEVYQTPEIVPTPETERIYLDDITNPRYSYAGGKIISELLALNLLRKEATDCIIFRPHNVYGPAMGFEHVIPEFMVKIKEASNNFTEKKIFVKIQGSGKETRAFCYIDNAVHGILLCGEYGKDGEIYHVGESRETRIIDLLNSMGDILGIEIEIETSSLLKGSTPRRCPDTGKLTALGYNPEITFSSGLEKTVNWYKDKLLG